MEQARDMELVGRLRAGDADALRVVYERYRKDVLAAAATMLCGSDAAGDVLHDVFVSLARSAAALPADVKLRPYLVAAGANRCRDLLRAAKRADAGQRQHEPPRPASDPVHLVASDEQSRLLWQAVADLPDVQRAVVTLHIHGGLTFREIARIEAIPENTAQPRYRYAIEKLRTRFAGAER